MKANSASSSVPETLVDIRAWRRWLCALSALGATLSPAPAIAQATATIDTYRELEIVHPAVVDPFQNDGLSANGGPLSAGGPLSFRTLIEQLAPLPSGAHPDPVNEYLRDLFEPWSTGFSVPDSEILPPRNAERVEQLLFSQFSHIDASGHRVFDLWRAPFELIGIANRLDLRSPDRGNNGELRFVYKLTHPDQPDLEFTIIIEFLVPFSADFSDGQHWEAVDWAREWHALGTLEIGSAEYLAQLQSITDRVTRRAAGHATPRLAHIRSNEKALDAADDTGHWEMREFRPTSSGFITPSVLENSPLQALNNTAPLRDFVLAAPELASQDTSFLSFLMPASLPGNLPFLGARAIMGSSFRWQAPGPSLQDPPLTQNNSVAMDNFGLLTCNGCHNENKTAGDLPFLHISPLAGPGEDGTARLSRFLTQGDPNNGARRPADLARRADDLRLLVQMLPGG
jgi:hypothetical protein